MLKTIDRYIIRKYLSTFFFLTLIFSLIAIVIDFSEKIDDYLEDDIPISGMFWDYYLNYIPYINGLLWPLFSLIAVIFFTSRMAYNSEIISVYNAGASFFRMLVPYLIAAGLIAGLHFVGNHYIIPEGNKKRIDFENTYIWKHNYENRSKHIHLFLNETDKLYFRRFNIKDSTGMDMTLEKIVDGKLLSKLTAQRATWNGEKESWTLKNYRIRTMGAVKEKLIQGTELDTVLAVVPDDLARRDNLKETMTTQELVRYINSERKRGIGNVQKFEVERHRRSADPFSIIILTIIGMSVASRKVRGGMGLHLLVGAILGGAFIFLSKFSTTFSINAGLPAEIGVWVPNMIFTGITLILILRAQK